MKAVELIMYVDAQKQSIHSEMGPGIIEVEIYLHASNPTPLSTESHLGNP